MNADRRNACQSISSIISGQVLPIKPYGSVYAGRKFKMARINIDGDALLFETVNLAGVTYRFSGKLVRSDEPKTPTLKGFSAPSAPNALFTEQENTSHAFPRSC